MISRTYLRHHRTRAAVHTIIGLTAAACATAPLCALHNLFGPWAVRYALIGYAALAITLLAIRRAIHHVHVLEIFSGDIKKHLDNHRTDC